MKYLNTKTISHFTEVNWKHVIMGFSLIDVKF